MTSCHRTQSTAWCWASPRNCEHAFKAGGHFEHDKLQFWVNQLLFFYYTLTAVNNILML